jgi:HlyD family secretion protein
VIKRKKSPQESSDTAIDFLPDADEIARAPLPRMAQITLHLLASLLILFIVWASISEVDQVVVTRGRLMNPQPNIILQPLETSIIQKINVKQGQVVKKGEELATLDPTFTAADEAQLRTRLASLDNQRQRLEAEMAGKPLPASPKDDADKQLQNRLASERQASYAAQLNKYNENIARVRASLETNRREQEALVARVRLLKEMSTLQNDLVAQKFAVRTRALEAQDRLMEAQRAADLASNKAQELRKELGGIQADRDAFQTGWRQKAMEELLSITRERDNLNEQLQKADMRSRMVVLTAPSDAVVLEIAKLSPGSVIREAEPLFTLVPLGETLEAEVQIESMDVGYVKPGDTTHIKLDAFPFQKHGMVEGNIRTISEDSFRRENNNGGVDGYYLGRLQLTKTQLNNLPEKARLLPGMTLSAEIVVGKRTVMSYLLWPLLKALDEAIHEP